MTNFGFPWTFFYTLARSAINRHSDILHSDKARPSAAVITHQKIMLFCTEVLPHLPNFPDLLPANYPKFLVLDNFFTRNIFDDLDDVKNIIRSIFHLNIKTFTDVRFISYKKSSKTLYMIVVSTYILGLYIFCVLCNASP